MKTIITTLLVTLSLTVFSQTEVIKVHFDEAVQIQDVADSVKWNTYNCILRGSGTMEFIITEDEESPVHLIVNTEDNKRFNLIIFWHDQKGKADWKREDMVLR